MTPAAEAAAPLFRDADPCGDLHIVVCDWNLDDSSIKFCQGVAEHPDDLELCRRLLDVSMPERWAIAITAESPVFDPKTYQSEEDV